MRSEDLHEARGGEDRQREGLQYVAVMNMPQIVIGRRNIVMPGARIWMMVVM